MRTGPTVTLLGKITFSLTMFVAAPAAVVAPVPPALTGTVFSPDTAAPFAG
jgi:serine acetyltransferase